MLSESDGELRRLRRAFKQLRAEAASNERKFRRSQSRQMQLLEADSLPELLIRMVNGLGRSIGLDAVRLVLIDPGHEIRHLLLDAGYACENFPGVSFMDGDDPLVPRLEAIHDPWLGPYRAAEHALLFAGTAPASIALLPLLRREKLLGCLCFGTRDAERYTEDHATDFLHQLAVIGSFALENAINRARLVRSGLTDVLTGWHNRRYLQSRIREALALARREGHPIICLMIDVDHFKNVNDRYGHPAGDEVLREVARRIGLKVRASDVSARYGGEEFVVLLPSTTLAQGEAFAERVRCAVAERPVARGGGALQVTVSIGVADCHPGKVKEDLALLAERLLGRADAALYAAKEGGRNTVAVDGRR